jgi:hypothetical protein
MYTLSTSGAYLDSLPAAESTSQGWQPAQQTQSPFFNLPAELRQLILRAAFGDRSLHIELHQLCCPEMYMNLWPGLTTVTARPGEPSAVAPRWRALRELAQTRAQEWLRLISRPLHRLRSKETLQSEHDPRSRGRWSGSICHRGRVRRQTGDGWADSAWGPSFVDLCWASDVLHDGKPPPLLPEHNSVGAMGFLLSCKRA